MGGLNNAENIDQIINYFSKAYAGTSGSQSLQVMEQTKQYVKDTANSIANLILAVGDEFDLLLQKQDKTMKDCTHKIAGIAMRIKLAQRSVSTVFRKELSGIRPSLPKQKKLRKLEEGKIPMLAKALPAWNHSKIDFDMLDMYGGNVGSSAYKASNKVVDPKKPKLLSETPLSPAIGAPPALLSATINPPPMLSIYFILK